MEAAPGEAALVARAAGAFERRFGRRPTLGAAAPGRINLIGEHTDYNGGFVLPIAIDRVCVAVGAPAADASRSRLLAVDLGEVVSLDFRRPIGVRGPGRGGPDGPNALERGHWASYIAGVVAQLARRAGPGVPNLDLAFLSSVPIGGGLSSSAAVEVATATLLEQALGERLDPREKALLCQRAEHEHAGVPCGIMDQFASVFGRAGHALLIDCRSQEITPIRLPAGGVAVLAINSGVRHALASGEYARRRESCQAAAAALGVASLRDATMPMLEGGRGRMGVVEYRRARHAIGENGRTLGAAGALQSGDLDAMGRLMRESHASLRDDYEVSCAELDTLVELASAQPGVHGARMTGAGFGGCIVALVRPEVVPEVSRAVAEGYRQRHGRECTVLATSASDGARAVGL